MSRLIVTELLTLDGVMEAPGGEPGHPHTGWAIDFMGEEQVALKHAEVMVAERLLLGRVTYESFAEGWSPRSGRFADRMNAMPKHVVSASLVDAGWTNSTIIRGDVVQAVADLKKAEGGPILVAGSRTLVHTLMEHDLVDEFRLTIFPVVVGSGRRMFPETPHKTTLHLVDSLTFASGVTVQTYRVAGAA